MIALTMVLLAVGFLAAGFLAGWLARGFKKEFAPDRAILGRDNPLDTRKGDRW